MAATRVATSAIGLAFPPVPAGDYIEGLAFFVAMLVGTIGGAALLAHRHLAVRGRIESLLATALLATVAILAVHILPAAAGLLSRGSVLVASLAWLAAAIALARRPRNLASPPGPATANVGEEPAPSTRWPFALAGLAIALVLALAAASLVERLTAAPLSVDVLNFHLPNVARWLESGSIWQIDVFLPDVAPGHYPNNGDVILLATVLPWRNDFLAHLAMYPYWALSGIAVYALGRELGARAPAAIVAACVFLAVPAVAVPALSAGLIDALMLFGFATGLLFLLRHRVSGAGIDLLLAGLGLGVAFGTKWYGVSAVGIVLVVWAVASAIEHRSLRSIAGPGLALLGLVALAGGVWMLRNLIESGNPVFPVRIAPFDLTVFDAPRDVVREAAGFTLLDYVGEGGVWSESIWPQLRRTLAGPAILVGLGFLAALVVASRRPSPAASRGTLLAAAGLALALGLAYLATPYSAGGPEGYPFLVSADARYVAPALLVAAALAAAVIGSAGRLAAIALAVAVPIALVDGARFSLGAYNEAAGLNVLAWAAAAAAGIALGLAWPAVAARLVAAGRAIEGRRALVVVGAVVSALALGAAGYAVEKRFNEERLLGADPATDWILTNAPSGNRIGLAGTWDDAGISPVLPSFGPRYGNEVEYVGVSDEDFLRRHRDAAGFEAALEAGGYDYLVVGKGRPEAPAVPEQQWARAAGYTPVIESRRLTLLAAPGAP